jgi:hypothetical protein
MLGKGIIYAGDLDGTQKGPMKWMGTHFEPATPAEKNEVRDALDNGGIPASPKYDNIGGWSRRMVVGDTSNGTLEKNAEVTVELEGKPMTFTMNSGYFDHEAFIDLSRPGKTPEKIWYLNERALRVSNATYSQIFGKD